MFFYDLQGKQRFVNKKDLQEAARLIALNAKELNGAVSLETIRGIEGLCAKHYFSVFDNLIKVNKAEFYFRIVLDARQWIT